MRPVNLLPQNERAVRPAEGLHGSSYVVLGVLGALVLAVLAFVVSQNQINDRQGQIGKAESEAQQARQRAQSLGAFGSFAAVKTQREESVRKLADQRFDWERFMRELALVLPSGTSLLEVNASTDGSTTPTGSSSSASAPAPAATTPGAPAAGPKVQITGCALTQSRVATLLVRLGKLNRATDVELKESAADDEAASASAGQAPSGGGAGNTGCPVKKFKFDLVVTFAPADSASSTGNDTNKSRRAPARLGGGA